MHSLQIKTDTTIRYIVLNSSKNVIYKNRHLSIQDCDICMYQKYTYNILLDRKSIKIGCQTFTLDNIKEIIRELKGENKSTETQKYIVKNIKAKKVNASTPKLLQETTDFYISVSKKAYDKKDYKIVEDSTFLKNILNIYSSWIYYKDYIVAKNTNCEKLELISKLEYLLEVYDFVEKIVHEEENKTK